MEAAGVISKVDEPTPWCTGMVVVLKKSGAVCIYVDLKPLNESILREVHPMAEVDEAILAGATVFSKLDANSDFWQIPLTEESRLLTTFITPAGDFASINSHSEFPALQSCSRSEWARSLQALCAKSTMYSFL